MPQLEVTDVRDGGRRRRFIVRNDGIGDPHELTIGTVAERLSTAVTRRSDSGPSEEKPGHSDGRHGTTRAASGSTRVRRLRFGPSRVRLEFACNIPSHYEDGMKGPIRFVKSRR